MKVGDKVEFPFGFTDDVKYSMEMRVGIITELDPTEGFMCLGVSRDGAFDKRSLRFVRVFSKEVKAITQDLKLRSVIENNPYPINDGYYVLPLQKVKLLEEEVYP